MEDLDASEYECPACNRKQPWRPESAGRPVTCACGVVLMIPFAPGEAQRPAGRQAVGRDPFIPPPEVEAADDADDADESDTSGEILLCPDCGATLISATEACTQCGYRRPKRKNRVFRRRPDRLKPAADHWDELTIRPFRDWRLPIGLAAAGFIIQISMLAHLFGRTIPAYHNWADALAIAPLIALLAASTVAVIFVIAILLTPVLDLSLGPVGPLIIKLAAAVIFPASVGALLWGLCGQKASGLAIGWLAGLILYLSLFRLLFEFDWPDSMLLIAFVSLAHTVILLVILFPMTLSALPLAELWQLYRPIAFQSAVTFLLAGGMVAPHFGQA